MKKSTSEVVGANFIADIVAADRRRGLHGGAVRTRFPPEPNGHLHIGHCKSIVLNFDIAGSAEGTCNIRFDDTNPERESGEYVEAMQRDIRWLGFDWGERLYFASDYFERFYHYAWRLTSDGLAYVDSLSPDQIRHYRGTPTEPGRNSPFRDRDIPENLLLLSQMRAGDHPEGSHVLRAKIDMAHPNLTMRDPIIYRIRHIHHYRTGESWHIYPMYDFAHCLSDAIEGITHSLCTLEFEEHRPLYDWFLERLRIPDPPKQIEFARLNISHTLLSKRQLTELVHRTMVAGWDDPRMPTLSGMRRRGYPACAVVAFCRSVGITKTESQIDMSHLDYFLRSELNMTAHRVMAVLRPLKVTIENWPSDRIEEIEAINNPEDPQAGSRLLSFGRELYIEQDDFRLDPPSKYFRLAPGREVRLKHAWYITCRQVIEDDTGRVIELRCEYDPASRGGGTADGRRVRGTLHWVAAAHAIDVEVRLYDRLFSIPDPSVRLKEGADLADLLTPNSIETLRGCKVEPSLGRARTGVGYQFLRQGYYCLDDRDATPQRPVFNRIVGLRDSWARLERQAVRSGS